MNPAQHSREEKRRSPELYCGQCLWRLSSGPCPRHPMTTAIGFRPSEPKTIDLMEALKASLKAKASPVDFVCKNCGEPRTTFNPREETICRHIERDAGNPHGNHVITTHQWERASKAIAASNGEPTASGSPSLASPLSDDDLTY